jgi:UPF0755 protein
MTEYGRGPGSEPWHPEDPLYGDQGWGDQAAAAGHAPYGGSQPQQQYPQAQQDAYQQQYGTQQDAYQQQQAHDPYQQPYDGGWDTEQQTAMPYGADQAGGQHRGHPAGYGNAQEADYYGTSEAYPPPQPPGRRQPEPATDWDNEAAQEETHPFFTGDDGRGDDGDDGYDEEPRGGGGRDRRGKGKKKSRNGLACLVVAAVLVGGLGAVGYFGYQFWQGQFGEPEDFAGSGSGTVAIEIPRGATGVQIGQILKREGVVKSVDAFVAAQLEHPKGTTIQEGSYVLKRGMSGKTAVELMLSPASRNNLIIFEGKRNSQIYADIDKRLGLKPGTTADVAQENLDSFGLPDWAKNHKNVKDPLEGFLFPAAYPVPKGTKPEDVLQKMVARANQEYKKADLEGKAKGLGVKNPWELLTVASLVQAEGTSHDDFRKMGEVVYNRLEPGNAQTNGMLEFDSTYNYIKDQSKIDLTLSELRNYDNPYNTYFYKGLPPGPIGNPGGEALQGVLSPTDDGWFYFISLDGKTSQFSRTNVEHQRLVDQFNKNRGQ